MSRSKPPVISKIVSICAVGVRHYRRIFKKTGTKARFSASFRDSKHAVPKAQEIRQILRYKRYRKPCGKYFSGGTIISGKRQQHYTYEK